MIFVTVTLHVHSVVLDFYLEQRYSHRVSEVCFHPNLLSIDKPLPLDTFPRLQYQCLSFLPAQDPLIFDTSARIYFIESIYFSCLF